MDLKRHRVNTIEQKIGRNLLLLQKIEYLLKYIVKHHNISAPISQLNKITKQKEDNLATQTMGTVLSQYLDQMNTTSDKNIENLNFEGESFHISFETQYNYNEVELERTKIMLTEILEERNYLVHHIIIDFDGDSHESCQNIENKLDEQRDKVLIVLKNLQVTVKEIIQFKNQLLNFIESGKFEQEMYCLMLANDFPLLIELARISINKHREDGWTSLAVAGKVIRQTIPDEVSQLKEKYNHKTLKSLLLSEKIFNIKEDVSQSMILFRLKSDWREYFEQYWKDIIE